MPDEQELSLAVHDQLRSKRSAIAELPDNKQDAIYSLTFERFLKPRLTKGGLTNEQLEAAKASYIKGLKGQSAPALNFVEEHKETALEGAGGVFSGVGAGIAGAVASGTRATSELLSGSSELTGLGEALVRPIEKFAKKGKEAAEYGSGKTYSKIADVVGKTIPGLVGAEAALPALETLTSGAGLTTLIEGAASTGSPGAKVAKAAAAGSGFDLGSGDNTSGRRAVQYAAFDFLSRPIGRLIAKTGGKYATAVLDYVGSAMDSRRSVGKTEAVTVGTEAAQKAESKLVTKLAELFPDKAERVKKGESLETVYSPEDVTKALSESRPKKVPKVKTPKVEVQPEQTTPAQKEKELEEEGKRVVSSNPSTQETIGVIEQLSASSGAKDVSGAGKVAPVESAVQRQLKEAGLKAKAGEGTSAAAPGQVVKTNVDQEIGTAKHEIDKNKSILSRDDVPEDQKKIAADNLKFWTEKHQELITPSKSKTEPFEYKIDWDRYKDKGADGVHLARSNAQHEVSIQAAEAANTIKSSPTLSAEEKQKALQALGDKAKHTLYKIKTEKVPEGFVSAKTRDAARKANEFATQTSTKSKESSESLQRSIATGSEDPAIKLIEDSRELESQYKAKGRTAFYNQIAKAWTKQGHGDIAKLNEMLKIGLEKVGEK